MPKRQQPAPPIFRPPAIKHRPKYTPSADSPAVYHDHTTENGRRYRGHRDQFPWPNDDLAVLSYSSLNTAWAYLLEDVGRDLISAPVVLYMGTKFLDCGARGTTWMYEVVEKYAGTRPAVIDPVCGWLWPTDVTVHHELEGEWPFTARQAFHYVRSLALGGMIADYGGLYRNAYEHLLPGGWYEVRDHDLQFFVDAGGGEEDDGAVKEKEEKLVLLRRWEKLMAEAAEKLGKPINMGAKHKEMMEQGGFTDVHEEVFKVGRWDEGKAYEQAGRAYMRHMRHGIEGYTLRLFTKTLGWSVENTRKFIHDLQEEIAESKLDSLRLYIWFRVVYGKKPKTASRKPEACGKADAANKEMQ